VTETIEMSTGNSANKLWRRRDLIKLLGATAISGPVILLETNAEAGSGTSLPSQIVQATAPTRAARDNFIYWTGLGLVVAVLAVTYLILRSRWGLALTAIRDSEQAAESIGVNNYRTKFIIYFLAAGATGSVGALISMQKLRISPDDAFSVNDWTAFVTFIVVIGASERWRDQ
jgi:ABC-type branched-subunit amino acid transport system permease subunit